MNYRVRPFGLAIGILWVWFAGVMNSLQAATFVYVSIGGEQAIAVYQQLPDGGVALAQRVPVAGAPGSLAVGPSKKHLYAALRSTSNVATLAIDPSTGNLRQVGTAAVAADPVYIMVDRSEHFLLTSYYAAGTAAIYPLQSNGTVNSDATSIIMTGKNPHSIQVDPSNRFVYIPNTGLDKVQEFRFDVTGGTLSPLSPPELFTGEKTGPRHFWFHPSLPKVYFVNEAGNSVTVCDWDRDSGLLRVGQTISTLPADFSGVSHCAHIEITPDGRFLYASNRGHDSLAMFEVHESSGELKSLGQAPTEKTPRAFTIDPSGQFVYAAGQASHRMVAYRIDPKTGVLHPFADYDVGKSPSWILAVTVP